jgi:hypothetical protein
LSKDSKESFGGFVGFQRVTGAPNRKDPISKFFAALASYQPDVAAVAIRRTIRRVLAAASYAAIPSTTAGAPARCTQN